jgi:hypothetical protein
MQPLGKLFQLSRPTQLFKGTIKPRLKVQIQASQESFKKVLADIGKKIRLRQAISFEQRAIALGDLGITSGKLKSLDGTICAQNGIKNIKIYDIDGKFPNDTMEKTMIHLIRVAKEERQNVLIIEGFNIMNDRLKEILPKRYKAAKIGGDFSNKYTITIPLK